MKRFILFVSFLFFKVSYSQVSGRFLNTDGVPRDVEFLDLSGRPMPINDHSNINGTPFLQKKWKFGIIELKNGNVFSDSSINYSLFDDKLFFRRDNNIYAIKYAVTGFSIENSEDSIQNKIYNFQNNFPAINRNDRSTFYEVLFAGKYLELLKWQHKKIKEIYNYSSPLQREFFLVQDYFIFFPKEKKIIELSSKVNLKELRKNLPTYSKQIDEYNATHKLNRKKKDDLIQLFSFLDSANL